jgi:cephalosporin-C deacetylase-like acetyl esterase/peptidoglycan/xylan/chitin deacetylase (PgdA/CDA1 family)
MRHRIIHLVVLHLTLLVGAHAAEVNSLVQADAIYVAKFKGDRAAAVSITLDDGLRNQDDVAVPLLRQYGVKATFFVIPGLTPDTSDEALKRKPGEWGGISWERLKELAEYGHEIASHTWAHESFFTHTDGQRIRMEPDKMEVQVAKAYEAIKDRIGVAPFTFASPGNAVDEVIRAVAHKYHPVIRDQCERFGAWPPTSKDFTTEQANATADRYLSQGKPLVWMVHAITDGYNAQSSTDVLENHLKYLKSREDVLWLDTYANVKRYTMERDAAKLTQSMTGGSATFTLECALDQTVFHDPLTVVIPVKEAAQVTAKSRNSGTELPVEVRRDRILIQAVPSVEPVEVTWRSEANVAKPKPVNPNAWIKAETDHPDAIYKCGEKAVFRVSFSDKAPSIPDGLAWTLTLDGAKVLKEGTVALKSGTATVEGTLEQPGVLQFTVKPTANVEELGIGMAGAAFDPYQIAPTARLPEDFEAFWHAQTAELAKVPLDAKIEPVAQDNAAVELFEVSFANIKGLRSHGYLAKPKGASSLPIMISQPGMGVHPNGLKESRWVIANAALGFLALDMSAHDMPMERTPEDEARWKKFMGYPYIGSDDRMTYYYLQVFTGMLRGIDYMTSRPDWNHKAIISSGGSQGGGLALIAAALDPRITAVVSVAPALGEHTGPLYGRPDAAPSGLIMGRDRRTPDPKIIAATAYYDTVNFARFVRVPVLMSSGLIDTACPPTTVLSIYNTLPGPKHIDLAPLVGHNQGPRFNALRSRFLIQHAGIADPSDKATTPTNLGAPIEKK